VGEAPFFFFATAMVTTGTPTHAPTHRVVTRRRPAAILCCVASVRRRKIGLTCQLDQLGAGSGTASWSDLQVTTNACKQLSFVRLPIVMFRPRLISTWSSGATLAISSPLLAGRIALFKPALPVRVLPVRSYSQSSPRTTTTFNRTKPGQTAARAPRASTATNFITFLTVSSIGIGAYLYQWNKNSEGSILSSFSTPQGLCIENWTPILLTNVTKITDQASIFEFRLPKPCVIPITSAIYVKDDEIQAMRAYTPIHSTEKEQDTIQFLIKRYGEGQVSRFIHSAQPGKKIEMRGPALIWPGSQHELEKWDEIGMVSWSVAV